MNDQRPTKSVDGVVVPLTDDEMVRAAAPMDGPGNRPATIEGRLLIKALTDDQASKLKQRDLLRLAGDPSVPEGNAVVTRVSKTLGLAIVDWFGMARQP